MAIGRFLFGIGADFDAVNSVNFQPMIDAIASGGFGVSAPTHDDLRGWILKNCVEEMAKEIDECKAMWKRTGCSILVEELNSDKGFKVLNFLVYCPEKVVFLKSVDASEVLSSADKLFELLSELVEEVGSTNVVQVITKCDDYYVDAGKRLMLVYPSLYWVPCAAHCIDQMLEEFGKLGWISETIEQAQAITRFVYNHSAFSSSATNFATLGRIAELKSNLQAMVTSAEWNECSYSEEPSGLVMNALTDEAFWKAVALVNHLTSPLLRALRIVCSEKRPAMGRNQIPVEHIYQSKNSIEQKRLSDLVFVQYNMRLRQLGPGSGDDTLDPLSHNRIDVLKEWVSGDQACVEGNGSADWKSLESIHRNQVAPIIDDTEDLGSGFDDIEIFKVEKEVRDEGYYTNTSEKLFTQYQAHIRGLNAYERHKKFLKDYGTTRLSISLKSILYPGVSYYLRSCWCSCLRFCSFILCFATLQFDFMGRISLQKLSLPVKTDQDTLREGYRYCIADMSKYKTGKMGLRWRTEKEVMTGKAKHTLIFKFRSKSHSEDDTDEEEKRKEGERSESNEKKKQKRNRSQSHSEYDTDEEDRRKGKTRKSKLESADREGKDDENFDEYMEGMFPGNG
nr:hypothetical 7K protein - Arabidopsis thaliana [Arabidopsis thaliana]